MSPALELPYEIRNVSPEEDKLIKKCVIGHTKTFIKCGKKGYVMPGAFKNHAREIYNMEVRPDDVWVITFPRSGTTWTQEMVWLLENNLDYVAARSTPLFERFPMLEISSMVPEMAVKLIKADFMNLASFQGLNDAIRVQSWEAINKAPSPRFIKTHLPLSLLPPDLLDKAKVIYVARDPRDIAVSYYYLHKMIAKSLYRASFKNFWDVYKRDLLPWTPVIAHNNEAWVQRHNKNLHFVFYEDMIKDLRKVIHGMCHFLGRNYLDEEINTLSDHLSFDSLRKNKNVNNTTDSNNIQFIRKGEAGGWVTHFDEPMTREGNEFLSTRLCGLDLRYPSFNEDHIECSRL